MVDIEQATFLATLTVAIMAYIRDMEDSIPQPLDRVLWIFSLSFGVWVVGIATVASMAMGGCLGERYSKFMSSNEALTATLSVVGTCLLLGAIAPLVISCNWYVRTVGSTMVPALVMVVFFPIAMLFLGWLQIRFMFKRINASH